MKKRLVAILLIIFVLMIAGCGNKGNAEEQNGTNGQITENQTAENGAISAEDTEEISLADGTETICEKTAVNLGEEESESRIIVQRNIQEMEISLTVYLTDGTSATIQYPMCTEKDYAYCETAYLQYDNKETIVLEIVNGTSNYGAAEYHVLHVEKKNGEFVIIEDATILDGQSLEEVSDRYSNSLIEFADYTNTSFTNEENLIITRSGKPSVHISVFNSNTREIERYYLYYDQEWRVESGDVDTYVSSPLDGVTMEVTEYSDTGVTVKIVNDTEKYIQCGDDFYLEVQDEESGEWREPDTIIDNGIFNAVAYMIKKDHPYEMVIDFEWLYGKLEPGRYHIVKTITDFRGSGDYTDYIYTAEFTVN